METENNRDRLRWKRENPIVQISESGFFLRFFMHLTRARGNKSDESWITLQNVCLLCCCFFFPILLFVLHFGAYEFIFICTVSDKWCRCTMCILYYGEYDLSLSLTLFHAIIHFLAWNACPYKYVSHLPVYGSGYCACWKPWKVACLREKWALISSHYHHFRYDTCTRSSHFAYGSKQKPSVDTLLLLATGLVTNVPKCQQCPNFVCCKQCVHCMHWFRVVIPLWMMERIKSD